MVAHCNDISRDVNNGTSLADFLTSRWMLHNAFQFLSSYAFRTVCYVGLPGRLTHETCIMPFLSGVVWWPQNWWLFRKKTRKRGVYFVLGPIVLTCFNFNLSMDK